MWLVCVCSVLFLRHLFRDRFLSTSPGESWQTMAAAYDSGSISELVVMDAAEVGKSSVDLGETTATKITIGVLALQGAFAEHIALLRACGANAHEVRTEKELEDCDGLVLPGGESTAMTLIAQRTGMWEPLQRWLTRTTKPTWGTCAGMILLADRATGTKSSGQPLLGGLDVTVHRNYFGSQVASFEAPISVSDAIRGDLGVGAGSSLPGVFIRAPAVISVGPAATPVATVKARPGDAGTPDWAQGKGLEAGLEGVAAVTTTVAGGGGGGGGGGEGSASGSGKEAAGGSGEVVVAVRQGGRFLATAFHPELTSHLGWHRMFVGMVRKHRDGAAGEESGKAGDKEKAETPEKAAAAGGESVAVAVST